MLANIWLSFLPGAKIGVLGPNGSRQVDAAADHGRQGGAVVRRRRARARRYGRLARAGAVARRAEGRARQRRGRRPRPARTCSTASTSISAKFAEPDADYDTLLAEQATVQDAIDRADAWQLDQHLDHAMDALRLPDGDRDVTTLSGGERRRVALCRLLRPRRACSSSTSRRTISTRSPSSGSSASSPNTPAPSSPSPTIATSSTTSQGGSSSSTAAAASRSAATTRPGSSRSRSGSRSKGRRSRPPPHARARAGVGAHEPARAPRQVEGSPGRVRAAVRGRSRA